MNAIWPSFAAGSEPSPFERFTREQWSALAESTPLPLTDADVERISSLGDPLDLAEVDAIYRPLSALLQMYVNASRRLSHDRHYFLREPQRPAVPFIIGVAGSVAVGKSSTARLLRELLRRWPNTPRVQLIATDGFLLPNAELKARGIMSKKGFPESYNRGALMKFMADVKSGASDVKAPVYSHLVYDIVPGEFEAVNRPDILIVEGLNVLQAARTAKGQTGAVAVSDYFDFSIYVDAEPEHIEAWYINRFLKLRSTAFSDEDSYFREYASLSDEEAVARAHEIWTAINLPNLTDNILPTRERATLVIKKDADHRVGELRLRKI
ncbi:MAG: type I pantothenate kinase [Actinomycetaceae bacterium]|nr:type I pantothenate kinase [Actinomycetaceae bacterium]